MTDEATRPRKSQGRQATGDRRIGSLVALAVLLGACASAPSSGPLGQVVRTTGGAGAHDALPLVIAMHGRGDRPERFAEVFDDLRVPARVISLRAPIDEGEGRAWFVFHWGFGRAMSDLSALVPRVTSTTRRARATYPTAGRPVVLGFSQGAMIAYGLAIRRPHDYAAVFPVSGALMEPFVPDGAREIAPIRAFHGTRDEVISASADERSIEPLRAIGADVELTRVRAAPHWMTRSMRSAVFDAMEPYLREQASSM